MAGYRGARNARVGIYRSSLEQRNAAHVEKLGGTAEFEAYKIQYVIPERTATYNPDFVLGNGIIVETKGIFEVADRQKQLFLREQHPELDIRLVFSSSKSKLYSGSKTTYGMWCEKHGIQYADKLIPASWLKEAAKPIPKGVLIKK
ncbi:putative endonuclease I [Pseudomonas phage phiIBB-PF7A]|uniref:Putative endonuclease I n=1 Tax=Pseudomonas phage phiIBB-PF7A TaxID=942165 RepID=E9KIF1_9CAUD|nr:endonuclease [Pseudomonas phage phiIBB-PF7A]ADV35676.1 putative endonuclease I [Pseudomonas phage phiIBB-PF7A]